MIDGPPRSRHVRRAAEEDVLRRAALQPLRERAGDFGRAAGIAEAAIAVPQDTVAGEAMNCVEVEVAAFQGRHEGELVADADAGDSVEIFGDGDVRFAAGVERDEE